MILDLTPMRTVFKRPVKRKTKRILDTANSDLLMSDVIALIDLYSSLHPDEEVFLDGDTEWYMSITRPAEVEEVYGDVLTVTIGDSYGELDEDSIKQIYTAKVANRNRRGY